MTHLHPLRFFKTSSHAADQGRVRDWIWLPLCIALSYLLFLPLLLSDPPFLCDDYAILATLTEDGGLDPDRMLSHFSKIHYGLSGSYYRPVFYLSYALDFLIGGANPLVYYLMNVLYHAGASWFLFLFLRRLGAGRTWSLLAMLVFLSHPIHIEAVAWIAGRTSSLAGMFYLASLAGFAAYRRRPRPLGLIGPGVFAGLGMLTREEGIVLPLVMLAADVFVRPRAAAGQGSRGRPGIAGLLAPYAVIAMVAGAYFAARSAVLADQAKGIAETLGELARPGRPAFIVSSIQRYLFPFNFAVTGIPSLWMKTLLLLPPAVLFLWGCARWRNKNVRDLWLTGAAVFLLASLPSLPILRVDANLLNSRCFYFPSAGLCILLAAGVGPAFPSQRPGAFLCLIPCAAMIVLILGGAGLLMANQSPYREAGRVCKAFLSEVRAAGVPVLVVPRFEYFPYADRDGDGTWNDEEALFRPDARSAPDEDGGPSGEELALVINVPRVIDGAYVFWGGLERALLPLFGEPGVNLLFTEMFTPRDPGLAPGGSFLGPLLRDGVPLLKWNGDRLVRASLAEGGEDSAAGREIGKARAVRTLGTPRLLNGSEFRAERFDPKMALQGGPPAEASFQYRILHDFGTTVIPALPRREAGTLIFDPWNEARAGPLFRTVNRIPSGMGAAGSPVHAFERLACLLYIELLEGGVVAARSVHLRFRVRFDWDDSSSGR